MRIPNTLTALADEGLIDEVVRPLMSGKEAEVFLVYAGGELRVAKVYKAAQNRSFKNRAEYTEGRKVRNSRDQRAIDKRSRHGRAQDEAAWRSTEVDMIYRLRAAGVRVPIPHHYIDGVLVMEMVADADGSPAPRLAEVSLDREQAIQVFDRLLAETVRMLAAGVVHGDLSDFNVLMSAAGPVIIDFPQSVDAAQNQNARRLLLRDVDNLKRFLRRFAPDQRPGAFAEEMWDLYATSALTPETRLTGRHRASERRVNTAAVLDLIGDANADERRRRQREGVGMRGVPQANAPRAPRQPNAPRQASEAAPRVYQARPQPPGQQQTPPPHQQQERQQARPPQHPHAGPRPPQHHGQRPPQHHHQHHGSPQHRAQRPPEPHGASGGHSNEAARSTRPSHDEASSASAPRADQAQPPPPRRRVVISVSTLERSPGSRRERRGPRPR